ncbi:PrsW family intramembrane metalloprotease [Candidatus Bipolaricaulota bacterium]|nr:PrsW family intramembrane metalloprotease [Candidatus Bipolaricaulota bacterium]
MNVQWGGALITGIVVLLLVWILLLRNADQQERRRGIGGLVLGLAAGFPVGGMMLLLTLVMPDSLGPLQSSLYGGFVGSALPAELGKLLILVIYIRRVGRGRSRRHGLQALDGVRLGAAIGLGLAAVESAFYLAVEGGWASMVLRAYPGVFIQTAAGAVIGYALTQRQTGTAGSSSSGIRRAWTQALLLHGGYGFAILAMIEVSYFQVYSSSNLTPLVMALFVLLVLVAVVAGNRLRRVFRLARSE